MSAAIIALKDLANSVIASVRTRFPVRQEAVETAAGALLICGFALIGLVLPALP